MLYVQMNCYIMMRKSGHLIILAKNLTTQTFLLLGEWGSGFQLTTPLI